MVEEERQRVRVSSKKRNPSTLVLNHLFFEQPAIGQFYGFDHIRFWVGNAKQAASYYTTRMGFEFEAYQGLETQSRDFCSHVVRNNGLIFVFTSPLESNNEEFSAHLAKHGDGVKDVAFSVDNAAGIYEKAVDRGAISVRAPETLEDEHGAVIIASVKTYGDTIHSFVQRKQADGTTYRGAFLPGFINHPERELFNGLIPIPELLYIDHVVGNQQDGEMEPVSQWYEQILDFHRFFTVDDKLFHESLSSLRSTVMADYDEVIKMPINEPAAGRRQSQIQEFCNYYGGPGVQHIAMRTESIIETVTRMKNRGVHFLDKIPDTYYDNLRLGLKNIDLQVQEDINELQREKILIDYDDKGYLLQIFTKPLEDRPTFFLEVI